MRSGLSRIRAELESRRRHLVLALNPSAFSWRSGSPASFQSWVESGQGRRPSAIPDGWRVAGVLPFASPSRIGVVLHVFYAELVDELLAQLKAIPVPFDLIVTNASGRPLTLGTGPFPQAANFAVLDVPNRGRDILPLIRLVNAGLLDPYSVVLKIHTAKSLWRDRHQLDETGSGWRGKLPNSLLGEADNVASILGCFASDPSLGMVTADGSVLGPEHWGDNQQVTASLLRRLELDFPRTLRFAAGSMYWARGFVLQGLRGLALSDEDFEPEGGQTDATTAHAIERLIGILAAEAGTSVLGRSQMSRAAPDLASFESRPNQQPRIRVIPFYLPQYHPIPENDRWWGSGFTEWANVAAALPVFPGHNQPKLPGELGFYDLRLPDVVARQVALAESAGIDGFMYYHYWFAGQQLLETPINDRLAGGLALPFCLMWANENWTRRWDGHDSEILMAQRYLGVPSSRFVDDVMPIILDPRYMRIDGRAILAIYRPRQIPDLPRVVQSWRESARRAGAGELFVLSVDVEAQSRGMNPAAEETGLDGRLGFPPHNALWQWVSFEQLEAPGSFRGRILSYVAMADDAIRQLRKGIDDTYFPGVMVGFDNTARRQGNADIWYGANPYTFRRWLAAAAKAVEDRPVDHRMVFVNAWNEWAEGAMLEPSSRFGRAYLLAVRDVVAI